MNANKRILKPGEIKLRSRLLEIFPVKCLVDLDELSINHSVDTNTKSKVCDTILRDWRIPFSPLGCGTNRYAIMIDGYCFKIAMDIDGKTDNKREFIYSMPLQPWVIKCYETFPNGLVGSFEYVQSFSLSDHMVTKTERKRILSEISTKFLIGDMGISDKNYSNWGYRITGDKDIVILDYAYIYSLSYRVFRCQCGGTLNYDDSDYNYLRCQNCGKVYSFWDVRKRIPRTVEAAEIGDMMKRGYILNNPEQIVTINPEFSEDRVVKKKKKEPDPEFTALSERGKALEKYDGVPRSIEDIVKEMEDEYKERNEENGKTKQEEIILGR